MVFSGLESELPIPGAGFTCKDPTNHSEDGRSCMLQPKTERPSQRLTGLLTEGHGVSRPWADYLTMHWLRCLGAVRHLGCGSHTHPQGC